MQIMVEKEAEDFLESNGFQVAKRKICKTSQEALITAKRFKYPVVMKIVSKKILHKSDSGGVALNIKTDQEVRKTFTKMKRLKGFEGVMIQKHIEGAFVLFGLKKDPTFGHIIAFGAGGIYTEIFRDTAFRVCPIIKEDAIEMIKETKYYNILKESRGKSYNIQPIISTLMKLSKLSQKNKKIKELDINPMILYGKNGVIVDARIIFD